VPPAIAASVGAGLLLGFRFATAPILTVACFILAYNVPFAVWSRRIERAGHGSDRSDLVFAVVQMMLDYTAMFLLIHFTGGPASMFTFFFVFHVIFAAILFRPGIAFMFAVVATVGMALLSLAELAGWVGGHAVTFRDASLSVVNGPVHAGVILLSFAATVFVTAASVTAVMRRFRERVVSLAEATERIARLSQDRVQFMLKVAHNMRAPVVASLGMVVAIEDGYLGEVKEEQREYLRRVIRRMRLLNTSVGEMLTLARSRDRESQMRREPVCLTDLAGHIEKMFGDEALRSGIEFRVDIDPGMPGINGDENMIEQMLENLVSNAIKYTPSGGRVGIIISRAGPHLVRIEVRDTGIGIPTTERSRLFSDFFRASNARRMEACGTGLGLAIVKAAAERHGGNVEVQSEEGKGSSFIVHLPSS
jgi:signal transduction histidine kinase